MPAPDFADRSDFENAVKGFSAVPRQEVIPGPDGRAAWNFAAIRFLEGAACPDTVDQSLSRQSGVLAYPPLAAGGNGGGDRGETAGTAEAADATFILTKPQLIGLPAGQGPDGVQHIGDPGVFSALLGVLDEADPDFPIVTP